MITTTFIAYISLTGRQSRKLAACSWSRVDDLRRLQAIRHAGPEAEHLAVEEELAVQRTPYRVRAAETMLLALHPRGMRLQERS